MRCGLRGGEGVVRVWEMRVGSVWKVQSSLPLGGTKDAMPRVILEERAVGGFCLVTFTFL